MKYRPFLVCGWVRGSSNMSTCKPELPKTCIARGCSGIFTKVPKDDRRECFVNMLPLVDDKRAERR